MSMYNLIEYNSNYSETRGSLWFCSKEETTNLIIIWKTSIILNISSIRQNHSEKQWLFTIKGTKLYFRVVTLSAKDNRKLSKLLCKRFEKLVYWNEYKTKSENKNTTNEYRYFL